MPRTAGLRTFALIGLVSFSVFFARTGALFNVVPLDAEAGPAMTTLFTRTNPRGPDEEIWRHSFGCRAWLVITRHRVTNEITAIRAVGPEALP